MVAGGIGQQLRNHHHIYDHGNNGFLQEHQPTLSTASVGEKQDVADRHPLKLHQHDGWQPSPQIQVQKVRGDTKKEEGDFGINPGHLPPPSLLQQHRYQNLQLKQLELGSHFEVSTLQGAGPDTDEFAQPQLPKRRFVLRPRPTKVVETNGDNHLLVSNILEGITSLCLGPTTSEFFSSNLMTTNNNNKIKKTRKCISNRRRRDWKDTNRSRQNQQPDRLNVQSKSPVPVVFPSFQTNMMNGNEMSIIVPSGDSKMNNGSSVHNSINDANATYTTADSSTSNGNTESGKNTDNLTQRRSKALIAPSSLTPSPEMLPGQSNSKRKRVVYPIASYEGSKLNCRKLVMERRQLFHQNLFRPVSNDDEIPPCDTTAIVVVD